MQHVDSSLGFYCRRNRVLRLLSCLGIAGWLAPTPAYSQEIVVAKYEYAVKVVCSLLTPVLDGSFAQGTYRSVVNVHNPLETKVEAAVKVALAGALGEEPSEFSVTPYRKASLGPDGAIQIDCGTVAGFFCPINGVCVDFAFLDAFLVIDSPASLDVTAVYTARHSGPDAEVQTLDVESVDGRRVVKRIRVQSEAARGEIKERRKYPTPKNP